MRGQPLVAEFRARGNILRARPTLAVVERQSVERAASEKQAAAVAKREMPYRSLQNHIRARQMACHERPIQPGERRRGDSLARQVVARGRCIAVLHGGGQRQHRR
jgi:hypothetical protein